MPPMQIVVCLKQVLDPDGVNAYALWGRLRVDERGTGFVADSAIPQIVNAYDEQAVEAALRLRDAGVDCRITALTVGPDAAAALLRRAIAMGADAGIHVADAAGPGTDGFRTAALIAAAVREIGDVGLVLCGRQGSDYDQGVVPAVLAERLAWPFVSMAAGAQPEGGGAGALRVVRATPLGEETVRVSLPAVVSVSNEIGTPRYPSSRRMMEARRIPPVVRPARELLGGEGPRAVELAQLFIPDVQGHCEVIQGETPEEKAAALLRRLRETRALGG
ncbi:MAG: electron transfer flavoprotein subunit beta/FixA family protein [Chloroflexi bacterium]|nr:electron transfer flavoprotein subunit beta/FixA family protein [Chloroflexota bacterium]